MHRTEKQARAEAMLGEAAELALVVARELAARLRESEDADQAVALSRAFDKALRAMRLTLALDGKLDRDAARDAATEALAAREAEAALRGEVLLAQEAHADAAAREPANPIAVRKARVRGLLNRLLWTESEGDEEEYEVLVEDLNARLDEAALSPDFEILAIETLARRVIADMGLTGDFALSLGEAPPPSRPVPAHEPQPADTG